MAKSSPRCCRKCMCRSINPGIMYRPFASIARSTLAGIFTCPADPASRMRLPRMTRTALAIGSRPVPSMRVAPRMRRTASFDGSCGGTGTWRASSLVVMSGRWRSWYCACAGALVDATPAITAAIRRRRARYMVPSANDATTNVDNLGLNDGHDSNGIRTCQQPLERCDASVALDGPTC